MSWGYSRPVKTLPTTKREGLCNWLQMAINRIEEGDYREAVLTLVDMLDTVSGNANPFAHITDGLSRDALNKELQAQRQAFQLEKADAIRKAYADGINTARAEMLAKLQEAA